MFTFEVVDNRQNVLAIGTDPEKVMVQAQWATFSTDEKYVVNVYSTKTGRRLGQFRTVLHD